MRAAMAGRLVARRRLLEIGVGGAAALAVASRPAIGGKAMAQTAPETLLYVSNAGDPAIHVLAMNRVSGELDLIDKVAIPGADEPSPTSMPLALNPAR